jgi:septal ring factor EnvC (AmiA/AmiB activator)
VLVFLIGTGVFFLLGYAVYSPQDVADTRTRMESMSQQNNALQTQVALLVADQQENTALIVSLDEQVSELDTRTNALRESAATASVELQDQVESLDELSNQLRENAALAATTQANAETSREAVSSFATSQAERFAELDEIEQRAERIMLFIDALNELADETTEDLDMSTTPTITRTPTVTRTAPTSTPTGTLTSTPTGTLTSTPTGTPTSANTPADTDVLTDTEAITITAVTVTVVPLLTETPTPTP